MSMPNIPDITPDIDISTEEAINLLLTSIAMEEISLAKIMEAESEKIKYVLQEYKHKRKNINDIVMVNDSVNSTIINISKLQMLLQWKLENIKQIMPNQQCHSKECNCDSTKKGCCSVIGNCGGCILNECDDFFCKRAKINAFLRSNSGRDENYLNYSIENKYKVYYMEAYPQYISIKYIDDCEDEIVLVKGKGRATRVLKDCRRITNDIEFQLNICNYAAHKSEFRMVINSCDILLNHDSGLVNTRGHMNSLRIKGY